MKKFLVILLTLVINMIPISVFAAEEQEFSVNSVVVEKAFSNEGYQMITSDKVNIIPEISAGLEISDQELERSWNVYVKSYLHKEEGTVSIQDIENYVQYAVDNNIIQDTPQARVALDKAVVRTFFKGVANAGKLLGFKTAGDLLLHSLQDYPSNLFYSYTSKQAKQIQNASECKKIVSDFQKYVSGKKLSQRGTSGSTTLNSTTDLHLAYNRVSYVASGSKNKKTGVWTLSIVFKDKYDFEKQAWKNAMTSNPIVTEINNMAAEAQKIKAIVPYDIKVTVKTTFKEL